MNGHMLDWRILLAEVDRLVHMGRRFRHGGSTWKLGHLIGFLGVLILIVVGAWLLSRYLSYRDGRGYHSPKALFRELCRAHGLDGTSRRLLWKLAQSQQLSQPAQIFLEPDCFDIEKVNGKLREQFDQLRAVHRTIFGPETAEQNDGDDAHNEQLGSGSTAEHSTVQA